MKKVIVKIWDSESRAWVPGVSGSFHCWGQAYEEFYAGLGNYTIAVVELPGGRIVTALPEDVKFIE
jgi:hypothetical protein